MSQAHYSFGVVIYLEQFFSDRDLFLRSAFVFFAMYFGLIVFPVLMMGVKIQPILRSIISLENAAREIGRGNLDAPIKFTKKQKRQGKSLDELKSLVDSFETMRIELKENHNNQSRMIMSISHDLKTPLTLIKGYVEALKDGMAETPREVEKYADIIYDRSMILEERINDLIYFAKLRTSDWQARFTIFSISQFLNETADIFSNDAHIRKRFFQYKNSLSADFMIAGDHKLLFQSLENLFDNACRHTKDDDILKLTAKITHNSVQIEFEDSGSGIEREHQKFIYDMFYRADSGRNTRGLGIGLSSVKTIIESHGGSISYKSSDLGGAGFLIELPVIDI